MPGPPRVTDHVIRAVGFGCVDDPAVLGPLDVDEGARVDALPARDVDGELEVVLLPVADLEVELAPLEDAYVFIGAVRRYDVGHQPTSHGHEVRTS